MVSTFAIEKQHEELLAHQLLEFRQRHAGAGMITPNLPQRLDAPLVHHAACGANIKQRAERRFAETALTDVRF
ncbi:hypothetical protein ACVIU4_005179 [Bradyrhizobium barranii subsp. barranii]